MQIQQQNSTMSSFLYGNKKNEAHLAAIFEL